MSGRTPAGRSFPSLGIRSTVVTMQRFALAVVYAGVLGLVSCADDSGIGDGGRRDGSAVDGANDGSNPDGSSGPTEVTVFGTGTPMDAARHFGGTPRTDAMRSATIQYPLDHVLFPRNVWAPDVQWDGAAAMGDLFRVRFAGGPVTLTAYVIHSGAMFRNDYVVDNTAWRQLANASGGRELTLVVDHWDSARDEVISGTPIRVRFARGSIAGAVYYWTLGTFGGTEGRIVRVMQGTDSAPAVQNFMPMPPPRADGMRCAACHSLSRNGNFLALSLGDGELGGVYDVTTDLTGPMPPAVFLFNQPWFFAAFNPDGSRILMTNPSQATTLLNGRNGAVVTPASGALPNATHPTWAPDGANVAMITSANDAWDLNRGDLSIMPAMSGDRFGAARVIHRGADLMSAPEGGPMDAYPTFSPDSRYLVFQHGTRVLVSARGATGALYVMSPSGGTPVRMNNASIGDAMGDGFYPNFTPFNTPNTDTDTVYWVLHYSRRDYGNRLAGTRGTHRRQIWVTALATNPTAGGDPSYVPYWLPGQEVAQENASAYWAPVPCRATGEACSSDSQCCSGNCVTLTAAMHACQPPPPSGCRREGESCGGNSDCCDRNFECAGGVCLATPG